MNVLQFETLESKLIQYRDSTVLVDSDVASIYGVTTKEEKAELVKKIDRFNKLTQF